MKKEEKELVSALKKFYSKNFDKLINIADTMHSAGEISDEAYEELSSEGFKKEAKKAPKKDDYRAKTVIDHPDKMMSDPRSPDYGRMMKWQSSGCGEGYVPYGESEFSKEEIKAAKAEYIAKIKADRERREQEDLQRRMARNGCGYSDNISYC
jgi:hypothetical protein